MKYLQFTYIAPGQFPDVIGLQFEWAQESRYPTPIPQFFGTCPDTSDINIEGVFRELLQSDYEQMRADEFNARKQPIKDQLAALDIKRIRPLVEGDTAFLATLTEQIIALRTQLQ
jgi:hypothetical protein